ncbi:hypothetical protein BJ912DRAFT_1060511 [Pholiota molesta]|nr:hypothetical protein BJ912DRAFT_1060511 [Pholiota molesta]
MPVIPVLAQHSLPTLSPVLYGDSKDLHADRGFPRGSSCTSSLFDNYNILDRGDESGIMFTGVKDHTMTHPLKTIGALVYTTHMAAVGGEIVVVRMAWTSRREERRDGRRRFWENGRCWGENTARTRLEVCDEWWVWVQASAGVNAAATSSDVPYRRPSAVLGPLSSPPAYNDSQAIHDSGRWVARRLRVQPSTPPAAPKAGPGMRLIVIAMYPPMALRRARPLFGVIVNGQATDLGRKWYAMDPCWRKVKGGGRRDRRHREL